MQRRHMLLSGIGLVTLALVPAARAEIPDAVAEAIREAVGAVDAIDGGIDFDLPERADNGAFVPFTVGVESPMTESDHVRAIHLFATSNPTPEIGSYRFTPASGRAEVTGRLRLAEDQTVLAYAVMSDGSVRRAAAAVEVSVGGCIT